jgi:hypothetical protein
MPLVRLLGQRFGTLVDHPDGQRGCLCLRGPPARPFTAQALGRVARQGVTGDPPAT